MGEMPIYHDYMKDIETKTKLKRLTGFLSRHKLDGVLLTHRNNFAWITNGRDNRIPNNSPVGVTTIYATASKLVCLANNIEAPRMRDEELVGTGIKTVEFPWYDRAAAKKVVAGVIDGKKVATDSEDFGLNLPALPADFSELRWSLTAGDIARYKEGAARATAAVEAVCQEVKPGMTEYDIAGALDMFVNSAGCTPVVTLVAADARIAQFRHPIPTGLKVKKMVMLVCCAEFGGMISNLTRWVAFGKLSADLRQRQQAIANIDTAVNLSTRPGRTLGEIFKDLQQAYADNGHAGQWQFHHQGGSTGYAGREAFANPTSAVKVLENQAFAWNPSIVGIKCEDTTLCTAGGTEILTACSKKWPRTVGHFGKQELSRPDVLVK